MTRTATQATRNPRWSAVVRAGSALLPEPRGMRPSYSKYLALRAPG